MKKIEKLVEVIKNYFLFFGWAVGETFIRLGLVFMGLLASVGILYVLGKIGGLIFS